MARKRRQPANQAASKQLDEQDETLQTKLVASIAEIDREVEARKKLILSLADAAALAIRNEFKVQLLKLPKKVRNLPLRELQAELAGEVSTTAVVVVKNALDRTAAATQQPADVPPTLQRTVKRKAVQFSNNPPPSTRNATLSAPNTVSRLGTAATPAVQTQTTRLPQNGELMYSKNGSPLGTFAQSNGRAMVVATPAVGQTSMQTPFVPSMAQSLVPAVTFVKNPSRGRGARTKQTDKAIVITLQDGTQVKLEDQESLKRLGVGQRKEVENYLETMQKLTATVLKK